MKQQSKIQNWLRQRNITLQAGFADELHRLATDYKKPANQAAKHGISAFRLQQNRRLPLAATAI